MLTQRNSAVNSNVGIALPESVSQIGVRIRRAREAANLRQEDVAKKLGVHVVTVSRWESGVPRLKADTIRELAKLFGVTANDLLGDTSAGPNTPAVSHSTNVSRGTSARVKLASRAMPMAVREYLAESRLEMVRAGALEDEIDEAIALMRSPDVFTFYEGGAGVVREHTEADVLKGMRALYNGVIKPELKKRGRKL